MQISVKSDIDKLAKQFKGFEKQVPFATSLALNRTVRETQKQLKSDLPQLIDRPTTYTKASLQYEKSTKRNLTAIIGFQGDGFGKAPRSRGTSSGPGIESSEYIGRLERGGLRTPALGRRNILVRAKNSQKEAGLVTRHGNLSRKKVKQLLAKSEAGSKKYFFGVPKGRPESAEGIYKRMGKKGRDNLVMLVSFAKQTKYSGNQLKFGQTVRAEVLKRFEKEFVAAIEKAIQTAK